VTEHLFKTLVTRSHGVTTRKRIYGAMNIFRIKLFTASETVNKMVKFLVCALKLPGNKTLSTRNLGLNEKSSK
jgi:hypothetical protein